MSPNKEDGRMFAGQMPHKWAVSDSLTSKKGKQEG